MHLDLYKGKKVLVTGHTGFKGSWLVQALLELGAEVVGYALEPNTNPNLFETLKLEQEIINHYADIRDAEKLEAVIAAEKPEIIFHLAAQPLVRFSYLEPKYTYETNVMGTINLFEAVRKNKLETVIVNVTTDKCYENKERLEGYKEGDPLGGYDPYSSSKACVEILSSSYRNSFFNPESYGQTHKVALATARAGNVIGGGDWSLDRLVPDCIKALSQGEELVIRSPKAIRPWQHVLEPVKAYLELAAKLCKNPTKYAQAYNFGPNEESAINVEALISKIIELWGSGSYRVESDGQPHEAKLLMLNIDKAEEELGIKPELSIDEALKLTIDWYQTQSSSESEIKKLSQDQIKDNLKILSLNAKM